MAENNRIYCHLITPNTFNSYKYP